MNFQPIQYYFRKLSEAMQRDPELIRDPVCCAVLLAINMNDMSLEIISGKLNKIGEHFPDIRNKTEEIYRFENRNLQFDPENYQDENEEGAIS